MNVISLLIFNMMAEAAVRENMRICIRKSSRGGNSFEENAPGEKISMCFANNQPYFQLYKKQTFINNGFGKIKLSLSSYHTGPGRRKA